MCGVVAVDKGEYGREEQNVGEFTSLDSKAQGDKRAAASFPYKTGAGTGSGNKGKWSYNEEQHQGSYELETGKRNPALGGTGRKASWTSQ